METFVLFAGTLTFISWFGRLRDPAKLYSFYCLAVLAFATRETLALLPLSIAVTHTHAIIKLHQRILAKNFIR
jgi:hypothetical protein